MQPTLDEIRLFEGALDDTAAGIGTFEHEEVAFAKGDRVVVTEGDVKNLEGYVVNVDNNTIKIKPDHEELKVRWREGGGASATVLHVTAIQHSCAVSHPCRTC